MFDFYAEKLNNEADKVEAVVDKLRNAVKFGKVELFGGGDVNEEIIIPLVLHLWQLKLDADSFRKIDYEEMNKLLGLDREGNQ